MSPFQLFGRAPELPTALPDTEPDVNWAPGPWTAPDAPPGAATRHARPVAFGRGDGLAPVDDDPPTDPYGFPPVPPAPPECATPDPLEAAALAAAFAADYLSWDEDDPARRGRALADHLAAPVADPARLGWDGRGRQRAELALPGRVRADGDDRVLVDVRVRVTPYREVGPAAEGRVDAAAERDRPTGAAQDGDPEVPGTPAAAPAPTGRGWRDCASSWVRLSVPVVAEDGRLGVDAADEAPEPGAERGDPSAEVAPGAAAVPDLRAVPTAVRVPGSAW